MNDPQETDRTATPDGIDGQPQPAPSSLPCRPAPPRLRIHHFMLWTAVTALLLTVNNLRDWNIPETSWSDFIRTVQALQTTLSGINTAVFALGVSWWLGGKAFFNQPGHWIATYASTSWLLASLEWITIMYIERVPILWGLLSLANSAAFVIIFIWVGRRVADTWLWKAYCWTQAAMIPLMGAILAARALRWGPGGTTFYYATGLIPSVLGILLIACAIHDWRSGSTRHWSHWVVVGAKMTTLAITTVVMIVGMLGGFG